jgi:hypothetical protein
LLARFVAPLHNTIQFANLIRRVTLVQAAHG